MEIGIYTFADVGADGSHGKRLRHLVEEIELADQVGLDVFGLGEHHRPDYSVSSPAVALAAGAAAGAAHASRPLPVQQIYEAKDLVCDFYRPDSLAETRASRVPAAWAAISRFGQSSLSTNTARSGRQCAMNRRAPPGVSSGTYW